MSLKQTLGLEEFSSLRDSEILERILEARRKHEREVVFFSGSKRARIKIPEVDTEGTYLKDGW